MPKYTIDLEGWVTIQADNEDHAYQIGQAIISEIDDLVSAHMTLAEPLELLIADNGVNEED